MNKTYSYFNRGTTALPNKDTPKSILKGKENQNQKVLLGNTRKLNHMYDNIARIINSHTSFRKRISISNFKVRNERQSTNKKILRKALSKMSEQKKTEEIRLEENNIDHLKQHINNSVKIHNQTLKSHQFILNNPKNEERKKFLKNQLSFTEIDEERIIAQKVILEQNHFLNSSIGKMTSIYQNQKRFTTTNDLSMNNSGHLLNQCFKTIDTSFDILEDMSKIGYNKRKNKYVLDYCRNIKTWMKEVYLQVSKDSSQNYSLHLKYIIVENAKIVKERLVQHVVKTNKIDMQQVLQDLQGLLEHIQKFLVQKKIIEIGNVGQFIEQKLMDRKQLIKQEKLRFNKGNNEKLNFTFDISQIEQRFGQMKTISKVSRNRFQQLNKSYQKLMAFC